MEITTNSIPELPEELKNANVIPLQEAIKLCQEHDVFTNIVEKHQTTILAKKERLRPIAEQEKKSKAKAAMCREVEKHNQIFRLKGGSGAAYFMKDKDGNTRFVIKPNDEDLCTLHNRKEHPTPFVAETQRARSDIPQYSSAENEVLSYDISKMCGFDVVPKTALVIKQSHHFHVVTDRANKGPATPTCYEKLCSAQAYVPNSEELFDVMVDEQRGGTNYQLNKKDYDEANIHCWVIGDQDAHAGNFLVYGEGRIAKVDSGLTFGTKYCEFSANELPEFTMGDKPLSSDSIQKIQEIPIESIAQRMEQLGKSQEAIEAMRGRVILLQNFVAEKPELSILELDRYMYQHLDGME